MQLSVYINWGENLEKLPDEWIFYALAHNYKGSKAPPVHHFSMCRLTCVGKEHSSSLDDSLVTYFTSLQPKSPLLQVYSEIQTYPLGCALPIYSVLLGVGHLKENLHHKKLALVQQLEELPVILHPHTKVGGRKMRPHPHLIHRYSSHASFPNRD